MRESKNLTLTAYESIKKMMLNYEIVPGQRLVFVDLAKQLNVSRTPVNNALSILAKEGYLDFIPNQGYWVRKLTEKEATSLYAIREILETGVLGKAIRQMTSDKLEKLYQCKVNYENSIKHQVSRKLFVLDMEFHGCIVDIVDNIFLSEHYRELCQKIFLRFTVDNLQLQRINEIVKEHDKLFEAISIKDVDRALELIKIHHHNSKTNLFKIIFD